MQRSANPQADTRFEMWLTACWLADVGVSLTISVLDFL